jgi:hypothetical protein
VSSQNQPHDVVEANTWVKRRAEGRKGADALRVNRGLDLAGIAENRGNPGRAILWTDLFFQESGGIGLWILRVHI